MSKKIEDYGRDKLLIILALTVLVTAAELIVACKQQSLMMCQNGCVGLLESVLLFLNVKGWEREGSPATKKLGRCLASCSDVLLACVFAGEMVYVVLGPAIGVQETANLILIIVVAAGAAVVDAICAMLCPKGVDELTGESKVNGESAQFKLIVGSCVNAVTVITSITIYKLHAFWLDKAMTCLIGSAVVVAVVVALNGRRQVVQTFEIRVFERVSSIR